MGEKDDLCIHDAKKKVTAHIVFLTQCCILIVVNYGRNTSYSHELHTSWICSLWSHQSSSQMSKEFQQLTTNYTSRSIRCTSQNTETVIQTFRQPTAAFISE